MGHSQERRYTRPTQWEVDEFKLLLGDELVKRYSKAELVQLYHDIHEAAELLLTLWFENSDQQPTDE